MAAVFGPALGLGRRPGGISLPPDPGSRHRAHGGGRVDGPADTPWNTRDLTTTDPDGNVVIFTAARPPELTDQAFSGQMRRWSSEQGVTGR